MPVPDRSARGFITIEYAKAYEAGALAALDYIADQWPHLAEPSDDYPGVTMATAEHIGQVIDLLLGRTSASPDEQSAKAEAS